jgi:hypothetical protein
VRREGGLGMRGEGTHLDVVPSDNGLGGEVHDVLSQINTLHSCLADGNTLLGTSAIAPLDANMCFTPGSGGRKAGQQRAEWGGCHRRRQAYQVMGRTRSRNGTRKCNPASHRRWNFPTLRRVAAKRRGDVTQNVSRKEGGGG